MEVCFMKNDKKRAKHETGEKHRVLTRHPEWELEKQTEGMTPSVVKASEKLEKEMEREAKTKRGTTEKSHKKSDE